MSLISILTPMANAWFSGDGERRPLQPVVRRQTSRALASPAGLSPKLVPSVEVVKVFPTINNPAVLELKDDAAADIQALATPLRGVAMNADHPAVITLEHLQQGGLEGMPEPEEPESAHHILGRSTDSVKSDRAGTPENRFHFSAGLITQEPERFSLSCGQSSTPPPARLSADS
jgi:hypothetical protein